MHGACDSPNDCVGCGKRYKVKKNLQRHMKKCASLTGCETGTEEKRTKCVCGFEGKSKLAQRRHEATCTANLGGGIPEVGDPRIHARAAQKLIAEGQDNSVCLICDGIIRYYDPTAKVIGVKIDGPPRPEWSNALEPSLGEPVEVEKYYTAGFVGLKLPHDCGGQWSKLLLSPSPNAFDVNAGGEVTARMCTKCSGALNKKLPSAPKFGISSGFAMGTLEHAQRTAGFPTNVTEQEFALAQRVVPRLQFRHWCVMAS